MLPDYSIGKSSEDGVYFRIDGGKWKDLTFLLSHPRLTKNSKELIVKILEIHDEQVTVNSLPDSLKRNIDDISLDFIRLILDKNEYTLKES